MFYHIALVITRLNSVSSPARVSPGCLCCSCCFIEGIVLPLGGAFLPVDGWSDRCCDIILDETPDNIIASKEV